jgi:hypothetical protein
LLAEMFHHFAPENHDEQKILVEKLLDEISPGACFISTILLASSCSISLSLSLSPNCLPSPFFTSKDKEHQKKLLFPAIAYLLHLEWVFDPDSESPATVFHSSTTIPMLERSSAIKQVERQMTKYITDSILPNVQGSYHLIVSPPP